ncbi:S1 RNA-binding domain-containing protein [Aliinostoc sp. HNIBRCY26]|uniref:S1 RNA-binding domain-containing protein n=1 Tax=Aliinostoc sp. HNIBRCY26 TaxID=3418997 RepID=UPI003D05A305
MDSDGIKASVAEVEFKFIFSSALNEIFIIMKRKINLSSFQPGQIILGKIIKLEPTGIIVDFDADQPAYITLQELSFSKIQSPEEAVQLNEIREFLVVRNYDGKNDIFFSHCTPETLQESDRLHETVLTIVTNKCGHPITKEDLLIDTKILAVHGGGVSIRIQWFLYSQERPPTVFFSILQIEKQKAWQRLRQLQADEVTLYPKILKTNSRGAIVKVEGVYGTVITYLDKQKRELVVEQEIPLKILEIKEDFDRLLLIHHSTFVRFRQLEVGQVVTGTVEKIRHYGVWVDIENLLAFLPKSEIHPSFFNYPDQALRVGDNVQVMIIELDSDNFRVKLGRTSNCPNISLRA